MHKYTLLTFNRLLKYITYCAHGFAHGEKVKEVTERCAASRTEEFQHGRMRHQKNYTNIRTNKTAKCAEKSLSLPRRVKVFVTEALSPFAWARVVVLGRGCGAAKTRPSGIDQKLISSRTKMQPNVLPALCR